jgi:hypothetical protein
MALGLAACSQSESKQVVENGSYPARMPLAAVSLPVEAAPQQPEGARWEASGNGVRFGVPGANALLALSCEHDRNGGALLQITREVRAESGAKALFALIGNGRIARLPLDAVRAGQNGEWKGQIAAADPRLEVLRGGNRIEATLPGGGSLKLPASNEPRQLLDSCRASGPRPA